ncbi:checkpoint protein HUS1 isoform X2 [Bactrocera neohumeralis]|uniref:checkpoint protein HUS1 isoform X2 n=1 Tax=Bactrocera neohumeralis TaxID=98809 RepID=UPI002165C387|nr:checkpoint protein HUS1 isoform X2 [Bactrocera neohumeralis]
MKFRAMMQDPEYMREFLYIIQTLSKLAKACVMKISMDKVYFVANEESGSTAPLVWVEIDPKQYFAEYTMQGVDSEKDPHIVLNIPTLNLGTALSLLLDIDAATKSSDKSRRAMHHVPVDVIPRCDWPHFAVPSIPECKLVLNVPSNRLIRGLIDKIKNLSPTIIFYATSAGEMNLVAETDMATITTRYQNLELRTINPGDGDKSKEQIEASCSVDCKKTALFFSALQIPSTELSCGIADDRLIHLEVNVRDGVTIHSKLPAVCI